MAQAQTQAHPPATIAILSIGQMGLGIASLLQSHAYTVTTTTHDRSPATRARAVSLGLKVLDTDAALVESADYFLSIVPPRDAIATAERVLAALDTLRSAQPPATPPRTLYYLDLNAISPGTARRIDALFTEHAGDRVRLVDGAIIGLPPSPPSSSSTKEPHASPGADWTRPGIPLSGPHALPDAHLASVLNARHIGPEIGTASGLKCCFAALTKGFTALALQAFTTAETLGVRPLLNEYMDAYNPHARAKAERGVVGCTGKAYRWVEEMRQIEACFAGEGGWDQAGVFREIAAVYQGLADVVEKEGTEGMRDVDGVVGVLNQNLKQN